MLGLIKKETFEQAAAANSPHRGLVVGIMPGILQKQPGGQCGWRRVSSGEGIRRGGQRLMEGPDRTVPGKSLL